MRWHAWAWAGFCAVGISANALGQSAPPPASSPPPGTNSNPQGQTALPAKSAASATFASEADAPPEVALPVDVPVPPELEDAAHWPSLFRRYEYRNTYLMGGIGSTLNGITSLTTAVASRATGINGSDSYTNITVNQTATATILPGLLTVMNAESARPIDRVFFGYAYDFHVRGNQSRAANIIPMNTGFNLDRFDVGIEKTFLGGDGSAYVRVPYISAADNTTNQQITGLGDVSAGLKYALYANSETGSVLSAGFTASFSTVRTAVLKTNSFIVTANVAKPLKLGIPPPPGVLTTGTTGSVQSTISSNINPSFLQPYISGTLICDRLFISNYLGFVYSSDDRVSNFINDDFAFGYQVYSKAYGCLRSFTPTVDLQFITPTNHQGTPAPYPAAFSPPVSNPNQLATQPALAQDSSTQVFVGLGGQFGLWERTIFSTSVVIPAAGPKSFNVGYTVGLNFLY